MSEFTTDLSVLARGRDVSTVESKVPAPPSRWRTRVLLPGLLVGAFLALGGYAARGVLFPGLDVQVVPVVAKSSQQTGGGVQFQAPGWVEADPYMISVSALTDGVVKEMQVLEGDRVKAGQVVARMVDDDAKLALERLEAEMRQRRAEVESAKAGLAAAQRDWDHPIERTRALATSKGMLEEAKAELAKLDADAAVEQAKLELLKEQLRREESVGPDAIAPFQVIKTSLEVKAQAATAQSVRDRKPILAARIRQLEAEVTAADENLKLRIAEKKELEEAQAKLAGAEAALVETQAKRNEAELRLKRMDVVSPANGIVLLRLINPGDKLMLAGDMRHSAHVVHLYDPDKLQVRVDVPLADAAKVSVGQQAKIVVDVLPETVFDGEVSRVVHEADIQKNTMQVKVAIHNPVAALKPEMLAKVQFLEPMKKVAGEAVQRVFVPKNLVYGSGSDAEVWIVDMGEGVARRRSVTLGNEESEGWVLVESGLQPGDRLIAGDPARLHDGAKINVVGEAR
ncbi:MAG: efflux RND transporter periplasmic adaptor subunit [Planctomycetes bacterium]|nr:efflux RND transporter periplasmic adaptor subunit [Planctomycetota bacterium]